MTMGFDVLARATWNKKNQQLITKNFKGKASQWTGDNLAPARQALRKELLKSQKYCCAYCRRKIGLTTGLHQVDHILPSSKHPKFTYTRINLVATCARCNRLKGDLDPRWNITAAADAYPEHLNGWKWVHPYLHNFSSHIRIRESFIFEVVPRSGIARQRALAVIEKCKLFKLSTIERRATSETMRRGGDSLDGILQAIWTHRELSNRDLARLIKGRHKLKDSLGEIENYLIQIRSTGRDAVQALLSGKRLV
jgi:uncharacterized protein (TIGR02646 family)